MSRSRVLTLARATVVTFIALTSAGCVRSPDTIIVGSMNSTEQLLLSEIVAQHLEHRLGRKVERRPNLGDTRLAYQALQGGEISMYPEYTGSIMSEILKERPANDDSLIFERAKGEMKRLAQAELLNPLGIDNSFVVVIRSDDSRANKVSTLSEAAQVRDGWILGASQEFRQLPDGMAALTQYKLPLKAAPRSMEGALLFKALDQNVVTMVVGHATDGVLTEKHWKTLRDDRRLFVSKQACLLVQESLLMTQPGVRPALEELSGKITTDQMRQLNASVDVGHLQAREVAASFLKQLEHQ